MSLLEMMIAEQAQAKKNKEAEQLEAAKKLSQTFGGGGFKKGFFGKNSDTKTRTKPSRTSEILDAKSDVGMLSIVESKDMADAVDTTPDLNDIPTIHKNTKHTSPLVLNDVQEAMKGDNAMVEKLKQGDWMTPDLLSVIQTNPILAQGLRNPVCMAAVQLMQSDPNEAKKRFQGQPEVEAFLREFGTVMSGHFETLGAKNGPKNDASGPTTNIGPVMELGPLQSAALRRAKQATANGSSPTSAADVKEERVNEVLADEELRTLLLDPELQQIIADCSDPVRFQHHMHNAITAHKLRRLLDAGLLGVAK